MLPVQLTMSSGSSSLGSNAEGLRERLPHQPKAPTKVDSVDTAQDTVKVLNEQQASEKKDEREKKTFGRTPDGTGAYTRPSFNGFRASHVWDSKYTIPSKTKKSTVRARSPRPIFPQTNITDVTK